MARLTTIYPGSATNTTAINPTQVATSVNGQTGDVTLGATDITDLGEFIDDRVNSLLVAGTNVSKTYDDDANSLTLDVLNVAAGTHSHTSSDVTDFTEAAQDAAASMLTDGSHTGVTATYNDASGTLDLAVTGGGLFASTTPALVQHKKTSSARTAATQSFTLDSTPTVGNMLLYVMTGYAGSDVDIPSGWSVMVTAANMPTNQKALVLYRIVQSGDGTSWSFTTTNGQPKNSSMIEVSGVYSWDYKVSSGMYGAVQQVGSISRGLADALVFFAVEVDNNMSSVSLATGTTKLHDFVDGTTNHSGAFGQFDTVLTYDGATLEASTTATWSGVPTTPIGLTLALLGQVSLV